ncbi:MAG: prolyl aminopeptidase [Rhodospirillaceae bacterium]
MAAYDTRRSGGDDLYPVIDPYDHGMLDVGDGHSMYWEQSGNPKGQPVVFLHGGPGAGTTPNHRRFFDPAHYRIVLFDQRGAGRSEPYADVSNNRTDHLVRDIEVLRTLLGIDKWLVFGGSWGATLAMVYAIRPADRCLGLVLRGVFMGRQRELDWFLDGIRNVYPEAWQTFVEFLPPDERGAIQHAYYRRLMDPDPAVHGPAASAWNHYETQCSTFRHRPTSVIGGSGAAALALARLEAHYFVNRIFLDEDEILTNIGVAAHLPACTVQGRYDMICPMVTAKALADAWPGMVLKVVDDAGHSAMEPGIRHGLVEATNQFR